MGVKRIEAEEAARLLDEGYTYIDVRSVPEFAQGHPPNAYNVPFMNMIPGKGLAANPAFIDVMKANFDAGDRLIIGCRSGGRSAKAASQLAAAGFTDLCDLRGGFEAETGPGGAVTCPGWSRCGLPTETEPQPGRDYDALSTATRT